MTGVVLAISPWVSFTWLTQRLVGGFVSWVDPEAWEERIKTEGRFQSIAGYYMDILGILFVISYNRAALRQA